MSGFEQEWKNRRDSTLTTKSSQETTVGPEAAPALETLTARQNAVIQMQKSHGNAAVCRMLARSPDAVQRFDSADHQNLNDPEPSSGAGGAANDTNAPLTPTLTPELFRDIEVADNGLQKVTPALETVRRNVHIMRSVTPASAVNQPMPLRTAAYATTSHWSNLALDNTIYPPTKAITELYEVVNKRYETE